MVLHSILTIWGSYIEASVGGGFHNTREAEERKAVLMSLERSRERRGGNWTTHLDCSGTRLEARNDHMKEGKVGAGM